MKKLLLVLALGYVMDVNASDISERREHIEQMETKISISSAKRKFRSEQILSKYDVPINKNLPYIEDEHEALVRSTEEIAKRAIALLTVAVKAHGVNQEGIDGIVETYDLESVLSPNEVKFINDESPSEYDKAQFSWRYEAAWVLLWALGYVEELSYPSTLCDVNAAIAFVDQRSTEQFISDAKLRPIAEILDETDLIYRYHWAVVDDRINGRPPPSEINSSVVLERHYTLNWLVGYMGQEWDDVSTDT